MTEKARIAETSDEDPREEDVLFLDEYQTRAAGTNIEVEDYPDFLDPTLVKNVMGLADEAGEVQGKVKKAIREDEEAYMEVARDELGDCLWYLAMVAEGLDTSLSTVASENVAKLADREERGVITGSGDDR